MNETRFWCTSYIKIDGEDEISEITSTPGHKYYLPENVGCREVGERLEHASYEGLSEKWVSAEDLKAGDKVLLSSGKYGIIIKVETKELDEPETTYNFEVEDFHTYYVGDQGILVHNRSCGIEVTDDMIRDAMKDAPLKTQQAKISKPLVQDYVDDLLRGSVAPAIRVDKGIIVDGNHRYIAGRIVGIEPAQVPWAGGNPSRVVPWDKVFIDPIRW